MVDRKQPNWLTLERALELHRQSDGVPQPPIFGKFVEFEEAVRWIAHGTFGWPGFGPLPLSHLIGDLLLTEANEHAGREALASELLLGKLIEQEVTLFGTLAESERRKRVDEGDTDYAYNRTLLIPATDLVGQSEIIGDDGYYLHDREFDRLLVSVDFLFSNFSRYDAQTNNKGIPVSSHLTNNSETLRAELVAPSKRGRPAKWNWEWLMTEVIVLANTPDGLPDKQADLEVWAAEQFLNKYNAEPSASLIRKKVGPIYQRLRSKSQ